MKERSLPRDLTCMTNLKIQFLDFPESDAIYNAVWDHIEKLEKITDQIISCHVIISKPHRKQHQGNIYQVKLRLHLSGTDIIVDKDPGQNHAHEDVYVAIRDAFFAARRKVEDFVRIRSGRTKERTRPQLHGKIIRLLPFDDCGFLRSEDQREVYFHRNSLLNSNLEELELGQEVRYSEGMGENGPQVTSMEVIGHSGRHLSP